MDGVKSGVRSGSDVKMHHQGSGTGSYVSRGQAKNQMGSRVIGKVIW